MPASFPTRQVGSRMSLSWSRARAAFAAAAVFLAACSSPSDSPPGAACGEGRTLRAGFYAFFEPNGQPRLRANLESDS